MSKEIQFLREATIEIKQLRHQNEIMRARLDMFDSMEALLHTKVASKGEGMSPDLVRTIEMHIKREEANV